MDIINLVTSVKEWLFLQGAILPYDLIVWEKQPVDLDSTYKHMTLTDVSYDFAVSWKLAALSEKYDRILVIIETIPAMYLFPRLSALGDVKSVSVIAVNAGIAWYMNKAKWDMNDIDTLIGIAHVKEVYDRDTLVAALKEKGKNYIRLSYGDTHSSLFEKPAKTEWGIVDFREHGFEWVAWTIIAPGGVLVNTIHAVQDLQNEWKLFDLFGLLDYDFVISWALKESIIKTENVIVLLDHKRKSLYESIIKAKLWDSWLVDTQIYFVYPSAEKINTILPEYIWEQANWDGLGIAEKINSIH